MLNHLAGATIQLANLVNYNCHPLEDGNYQVSSENVTYPNSMGESSKFLKS